MLLCTCSIQTIEDTDNLKIAKSMRAGGPETEVRLVVALPIMAESERECVDLQG